MSKKLRWLIGAGLFGLATLALWQWLAPQQSLLEATRSALAAFSSPEDITATPHQAETLTAADAAIAAAEQSLNTEADLPTSPSPPSPWQLASSGSPAPAIQLSPRIASFAAVSVPSPPQYLPTKGDKITLPLLGGEHVTVNVENNKSLQNGDYSWSGHVDGHDRTYPVVVTYGKQSMFATITTAAGSFSLESVNGLGWLYKNPSEPELSKPGQPDFLEVTQTSP